MVDIRVQKSRLLFRSFICALATLCLACGGARSPTRPAEHTFGADVRLICLAPLTVYEALGPNVSDERYDESFVDYLAAAPQSDQGMALARGVFEPGGANALLQARSQVADSGPCPFGSMLEGIETAWAEREPAEAGSGSLLKMTIRLVIQQRISAVRDCYLNSQLAGNGEGRVVVRIVIGGEGPVLSVEVVQASDGAPGECVADVARTLVFPAPRGGGTVTVTYPFVFSPAPPG